jgi:ABC-2 type transport system permease protein
MITSVRSEFRKIVTTRAWWLNALVMFAYMAILGVIMAATFVLGARASQDAGAVLPGGAPVVEPQDIASSVYTLAVSLGYIFPAILGVLVVTTEFRHRTITATVLSEPDRTLVLGAKLPAVLPFAVVVAVAGVLGTVLGGAATLAVLGEPTFLSDTAMQRAIWLSVVALVVWALVGVGIGSVLTNQIAAIVVLLVFTQFVEPLLRLLLAQFSATEALSRYLPGAAGEAIVGSSLYTSSGLAELLQPWQGALVLIAYAVAFVVIGRVTTFRRDIS